MWKVMIIDDEKAIRSLLKVTLQRMDFELDIVGEAASGIEAINTIDTCKPDIAFVDIRMPFMDGIEFSKLAIERYPKLKVIILTAFNDFEYARKCIGIGVCEYLLKPISRDEIREVLCKTIEQLKAQPKEQEDESGEIYESNYSIGQIKEFIASHYNDQDINLTSIAQKFGFNACYLSRMFKQKAGICLNNYLSQCRMEKAIALARKGQLMYITAKEVGIPDPNYFSKCFKKYTGKIYSEFLRNHTSEIRP